jgi:hypothetical protein
MKPGQLQFIHEIGAGARRRLEGGDDRLAPEIFGNHGHGKAPLTAA